MCFPTGVTCSDSGDCVPEGVYGHTCHCSVGYVGLDCETSVCASLPCLHDGLCLVTDTGRGYVCECVEGWAGTGCETGRSSLSNNIGPILSKNLSRGTYDSCFTTAY